MGTVGTDAQILAGGATAAYPQAAASHERMMSASMNSAEASLSPAGSGEYQAQSSSQPDQKASEAQDK
jgi:hypothetical protein